MRGEVEPRNREAQPNYISLDCGYGNATTRVVSRE